MRQVFAAVFLVLLVGCVTPSDRVLNEHNRQAGEAIATNEALPVEVRQTGKDIHDNAEHLQVVGALPKPKEPTKYTPNASKDARDSSRKEHDNLNAIGDGLKSIVGKYVPGGAAILGLVGWLASIAKTRLESKKTYSLIQGVSDFSDKVPGLVNQLQSLDLKNPQGLQDAVAIIRSGVKDAQATAQSAVGVYQEVRADVKAAQQDGTVKPIETKTLAEKAADPADPYQQ